MNLQSFQPIIPIAHNTQSAGISNLQEIFNAGLQNTIKNPTSVNDGLAFQNILDAYMGIVNSAGRAEQNAQHLAVEFALGNHDDMLSVILAQEMADISVNFAVQVTSRIIESYREIMRMQI